MLFVDLHHGLISPYIVHCCSISVFCFSVDWFQLLFFERQVAFAHFVSSMALFISKEPKMHITSSDRCQCDFLSKTPKYWVQ